MDPVQLGRHNTSLELGFRSVECEVRKGKKSPRPMGTAYYFSIINQQSKNCNILRIQYLLCRVEWTNTPAPKRGRGFFAVFFAHNVGKKTAIFMLPGVWPFIVSLKNSTYSRPPAPMFAGRGRGSFFKAVFLAIRAKKPQFKLSPAPILGRGPGGGGEMVQTVKTVRG